MYNERSVIASTVDALTKELDRTGKSWELVLVNDGSKDGTADVVRGLCEKDGRLKLVAYRHNRGRGYALRQGFAKAQGEVVITTEADLTWGAAIVSRFLEVLQDPEVDVVLASPHIPGGGYEEVPLGRRLLGTWGNKLLSLALPGKFHTVTGMTRAYRRKVLEVLDLSSDGKEIHLEIMARYWRWVLWCVRFRRCFRGRANADAPGEGVPFHRGDISGVICFSALMRVRLCLWVPSVFCCW
jgi:glycosyltransferase involved in cell wall biosynthesis